MFAYSQYFVLYRVGLLVGKQGRCMNTIYEYVTADIFCFFFFFTRERFAGLHLTHLHLNKTRS